MTQRPEKGQVDTTEDERSAGEHTLQYYLNAAGSKYCIGIQRCTVRDYQPWNPQYHRRGLLKADDTAYAITEGGYQAEFNDARNICLFGFKCETDLKKKAIVTTLGINDCRNVLITGNTGLASAPIGHGIIEVKRSDDITAANLARFSYKGDNSAKWYYILDCDWNRGILESEPGQESDKTNNVVSLFKRGHCVPVPIQPTD
jgi:hypothetical protein